jgi:hypothetical protein
MHLQLDHRHPTFHALERARTGSGWLRVHQHGLKRAMLSCHFPLSMQDVDAQTLVDCHVRFSRPLWRAYSFASGAGG